MCYETHTRTSPQGNYCFSVCALFLFAYLSRTQCNILRRVRHADVRHQCVFDRHSYGHVPYLDDAISAPRDQEGRVCIMYASMCVCMYVCMYVYLDDAVSAPRDQEGRVCVMYVCVCVCVCMCVYMYVCMYVCMYILMTLSVPPEKWGEASVLCMHLCVYVFIYLCMYVCKAWSCACKMCMQTYV